MKGRFICGVILAIFLGCVLFLAVSTIIFTKTEDYRRYGFHQNNHVMNINIYNEAYEGYLKRANINPDDTYDTVSVIAFDDTYCSVCIDNFDTTEKDVVKLKNCNHIFHKECIDKWIKINRTCPICRKGVVNDDETLILFFLLCIFMCINIKLKDVCLIIDKINEKMYDLLCEKDSLYKYEKKTEPKKKMPKCVALSGRWFWYYYLPQRNHFLGFFSAICRYCFQRGDWWRPGASVWLQGPDIVVAAGHPLYQ